ncbi:MAG: FAD-dependent oxidoreductase, partial [Dehalococcoidales bacterium]|nr:FAD-dependent oxidoreductase [Dehalococcoidales bacterium]
ESIVRYVNGEDMRADRFEDSIKPLPQELLPTTKDKEKIERAAPRELAVAKRVINFKEVEGGLTEEQALIEAERCLNCALCSECLQCATACDQSAVDHCMKDRAVDLDVGAVILTPGFTEFAAEKKGEFGFGRYHNVLTSVQFERMLSASGPFGGDVVRPSDGKPAKRIAWIQCVGSRDTRCGNEYCSSVCCMVSTKQAMIAADHVPGLEASIFYMDIRAYGKDFDQYYERAKQQGVSYIKGIPSSIMQMPGSKNLKLHFIDDANKVKEREFDLVVLSVGMEPSVSTLEAAKQLGIKLNEYEFCATDRLSPLETSRSGIFTAGSFQEPKDIPETVTQASAAASMAMELLASSRNTLITKTSFPDEHDTTDEPPRIGVFVCHCGHNIASVVDVERVRDEAAKEPDVVFTADTMFTCSNSSLDNIRDMIREHQLNRVVVASCTPRTHEPIFRDTLREAGLNQYLFELANIRDQCSWVHSSVPEAATQKATELVRMSIARARLLKPLQGSYFSVNQAGIIIGGGISGMTAALALADQGFKTILIEKSGHLGGNFRNLHYTLEHAEVKPFIDNLIKRVKKNPNIELHLNSDVKNVAGFIGSFEITLLEGNKESKATGGAIIVATGANPAMTKDFRLGQSPKIMTQVELEAVLYKKTFNRKVSNVVMIQCAGSRNNERSYCSRLCCSMAVKNALKLKERNPNINVYVLYRDIRTYGFREKYYQKARKSGVIFVRYEKEKPPVIAGDDELLVTLNSPDFPETIEIEADNVILSTGVDALKENRKLADMFKVPLNSDGFFNEAHLKLRPVDFATEGIFLCGLAHSPKMADENISQAKAAAARAATILSKTQLEVSAQVSTVDQDKCISCMTCVRACPYNAPSVNINRKAEINAAKCMGCGICASECPAEAIQLRHFESGQFKSMIEKLLQEYQEKEETPVLQKSGKV